jgi:hypothetical protein
MNLPDLKHYPAFRATGDERPFTRGEFAAALAAVRAIDRQAKPSPGELTDLVLARRLGPAVAAMAERDLVGAVCH